MESRCGILCSKCDWKKTQKCKGCFNIDNPFWGACPVKGCCEEKKLEHCGECTKKGTCKKQIPKFFCFPNYMDYYVLLFMFTNLLA